MAHTDDGSTIQSVQRQPAFRELLKQLRLAADLTQESLAERANVSTRLISDLERGAIHRPRRDTVRLLADALALSGSDRDSFVAIARGYATTPPSSLSVSIPNPGFIPRPPNEIVGRVKDAATATTLLRQPDVRCLTLTGPGGVGKTRLALEVAATLATSFRDSVVFIDLAPLRDPDLVVDAIARAVGTRDAGDGPLLDRLIADLRPANRLLVLDNVEHLLPAAPQIAALLSACPEISVLATSRARLRIRAEREYRVEPLSLPDPNLVGSTADLAQVAAVDLFVRRAEAADRQFGLTPENAATVAAITRRLDGLPLAIELAAARIRILSPAEILARLDHRLPLLADGPRDLPPRQQTMHATIAWSYDLLSPPERDLFADLSTFVGGATLDAIDAVARSQPDDAPALLDRVAALVDKCLIGRVHATDHAPRFGMLETIREFGHDRLVARGAAPAVQRAHAEWCLDLVERAEPELTGPRQESWIARLRAEHDNIRAALRWSLDSGSPLIALRICGALYRFWAAGGQYDEGARWIAAALAATPDAADDATGNALLGAGVMDYFRGDYPAAEHNWSAALARFDAADSIRGIAYSYGNLGLVADAGGNYPRAIACYERALQGFRSLDDETYIGFMLLNLGLIHYFQGNLDRAAAVTHESLAIARRNGAPDTIAYCLGNLGLIAFAKGDYAAATALQTETLILRRGLTNHTGLARSLENFALLAAAQGLPERAAQLFAAAECHRAAIGSSLPPNDSELNNRYKTRIQAEIGPDAYTSNQVHGASLTIEQAIDLALAGPSIAAANQSTVHVAHYAP